MKEQINYAAEKFIEKYSTPEEKKIAREAFTAGAIAMSITYQSIISEMEEQGALSASTPLWSPSDKDFEGYRKESIKRACDEYYGPEEEKK